jgi:hypothetical protein
VYLVKRARDRGREVFITQARERGRQVFITQARERRREVIAMQARERGLGTLFYAVTRVRKRMPLLRG